MTNKPHTLDEILAEFGRKCSPVATLRNVDNPLVRREYIDEAKALIQAEIVKARIEELERQEFQDVMMLYAEYETREVVKNRIAELSNKEQL